MAVQIISDVVNKLSDERRIIIYRLALDMLSAQQTEGFDYYSDKDIQAVTLSRQEIENGDYISFSTAEELTAYFE